MPNPCAGVTLPAALTGPHSAGLGIKFYTGNMFPKSYQNVAFIARRGSWNREQKFGYDVVVARTSGGKAKIEPFMTGLLDEKANTFHGRPTYVHADEGRLAAGVGRAERRDLPHHLSGARAPAGNCAADAVRLEISAAAGPRTGGRLFFGGAAAARRRMPLAERIQTCGACHGEDGNSKMENIPSIAGQPEFFMLNQLVLMREKVRPVEAMAPFVKDLKDDEIDSAGRAFRQAAAEAERRADRSGAGQARRGDRQRRSAAAPAIGRRWPGRSRSRASPSSASTI